MAVEVGLLRRQAQQLNAPYFKLRATGRPFVTAKWAMTLDGKVATRTGDSRWVSSEAARERVHQLRARSDAVLVGIGTALTDDPLLTCRAPGTRTLTRIVLDSGARLPVESRLVQTTGEAPLLVVVSESALPDRLRSLRERGAEVLVLPRAEKGVSVEALLDELGRREVTNLLVEGGPTVLADLFERKLVDEVVVYIAPKVVGGEGAPGAVAGEGVASMAEALRLDVRSIEQVGDDLEVQATVRDVYGSYFPPE